MSGPADGLRPRPLLEVAVATPEDARVAQAAGADRLELNAALELGGLTPSLGALIEIKRVTALPVVVMVRPRAGGFAYSEAEFRTMRRDADLALAHGADGLAFGVLAGDRTVDRERTRALVEQVGSRQAVFHRAFDVTPDALAALDQLVDLGVTRVLTSGQQATAPAGAGMIRRLIDRAGRRIEVLPGGGVTPGNVAVLLAQTGATQVHGSFSTQASDPAEPVCRDGYRTTSARLIVETREALARL